MSVQNVHHTKSKGDKGLAHVIACLTDHDIQIALPMSEHLPFDLIAVQGTKLLRVSVKYRTLTNGALVVPLSSVWSNKNGAHKIKLDRGAVDAHAVYCPETNECYFLRDTELKISATVFKLRVIKSKYNYPHIRLAELFVNPHRLFEANPDQTTADDQNEVERKAHLRKTCACGTPSKTGRCAKCFQTAQERTTWPNDVALATRVWEIPATTLAKELGVSSNAIKNRCKHRGINLPGRGYWQKRRTEYGSVA